MTGNGRRHIDASLIDRLHQCQSTARGLRFKSSLQIRRACIQAETALDAFVKIVLRWGVIGDEASFWCCRCSFQPECLISDLESEPTWVQSPVRIELLLHILHDLRGGCIDPEDINLSLDC